MKKRTQSEHGPRHVTPAGRSVFYDLGFDEAEARVLEGANERRLAGFQRRYAAGVGGACGIAADAEAGGLTPP